MNIKRLLATIGTAAMISAAPVLAPLPVLPIAAEAQEARRRRSHGRNVPTRRFEAGAQLVLRHGVA